MEFIRKNYEKIILGAVLVGLVGVLIGMWFVIMADKQQMRDMETTYIGGTPHPLPALDLSRQETALGRVKTPPELDFSTTNKLFNPVLWVRTKDNKIKKATGLGPRAVVVTKITPLYFSIAFNSFYADTKSYIFIVENQAAAMPALRHPQRHYVSMGGTVNNLFKLVSVNGPPANPTQLILRLADTGETATVTPDQPFRRVDGYTADLKYDPENLKFNGLRVGDHLSFAGDDYNVIAIDRNDVIILAQSNQRKFTLPYKP
jgi:hypothetical protein